jgi:hypothetical protein
MEDTVTLKTLALLISGGMLLMSFLWGFLYIVLIKKINIIYAMLNILAKGITDQHKEINDSLAVMYRNITEQHSLLEKYKKSMDSYDENDFH